MFCSECGKAARGKFCSHCGSPLAVEGSTDNTPEPEVTPDWDHEVRYEAILKYPGVRTTIDQHAKQAPKRLSGEEFLALCDKVMPMGVPMEKLAAVAQPLFTRLGIKTGKQRTQQVPAPAAKVLVRVLCSLARNGQTLRNVRQAEDGCLLEAALPSDVFSLEGDLLVSVRRTGGLAEVDATVRIGGQLYDWGKGNRCLNRLFDDLVRDAA